ncbi:lisH domain-containing protein C29A3.03c-like [Chenopodium quinoa]|uniref:lisH domain-containing protein C29A3.03c-like n=1 Tax=Chenopodium quinoa TaxID=63459 RepID=UPI000B785C70|nr:lisH domain-containing protein C29A3.03c-like [Chenopodium quinoa]
MELKGVKDAFDHVTKKQKMCSSKCHEAVEQIGQEVEQALIKLQSADASTSYPDHKAIIADLKTKLKEITQCSQLESSQKELNGPLSKYPKQLEKSFNPDISKAYRNVDFNNHTVNQIIASHLYREGLFEVGDCFANEAGEHEATALKCPFIEMYHIQQAMKSHNLEPALKWASANREILKQNGSDLELKLHRLQYVEILQNQGRDDALKYARTFLSPFASSHMAGIQKLMACLLWAGKLDSSPYSDLLAPINWEKLGEEFTRQFCNLLGQSFESPLSVSVAAGVQGLPTLLKLMNVMTSKKQEWQSMKQLPVPIELDKEFQFHTIFVCPVTRDQATEENPPMLMSCGHVLCKQSITKLSKSSTKTFKCPYCPAEIEATLCRRLYF